MSRIVVVGIVILALAILGLGVVLVFQTPISVSQNTAAQRATLATSTVKEETSKYVVSVAYPQFGIPVADAQIKAIVDKAVADFKSVPPMDQPDFPKYEFDGSYDSAYVGPDIVSAKMILYQYTGGAHGNAVAFGLNFNTTTGKDVSLDDALALIGKTLKQVSDAATQKLTKDFGIVQFPEGVAPTAGNYLTFIIDKTHVTFIFQQYQAEAYSAGMPQITFPRVK